MSINILKILNCEKKSIIASYKADLRERLQPSGGHLHCSPQLLQIHSV
jgi:hypothetical protein